MIRPIKAVVLLALVVLAFSSVRGVTALSMIFGGGGLAVAVFCPLDPIPGGDKLGRGFYVTNYSGHNLGRVQLQYSADPSGTYTISIIARLGAFDGPIIGSTQTVTVTLPSYLVDHRGLNVVFDFGGAIVTPGSTVTFTQTQIAGPGTALFNLGVGPCPGVHETNGTTPPLDTVRNEHVGLQIWEAPPPSSTTPPSLINWAIKSVSMVPPAPQVGQPVTFSAVLVALFSQQSGLAQSITYPQLEEMECTIDGASCGSGTVSYPGPDGTLFPVSTQTPWTATPGTHTLTWSAGSGHCVDVGQCVVDPDPSNNVMSTTFTVAGTSATTQATVTSATSQTSSVVSQTTQTPDFTLGVSPPSQSVSQGQTATYTIHVHALNGFNQQVALTVSGAPSGATAVLSIPSATPDFDSTLTIILSATASPGPFTLTVTGSGGGQSHQVNLVLIINQTPTQTQTSATTTQTSSMPPPGPNDLWSTIQQNGLLLGAGALILLLVVVVVAMRTRRK